MEPALEIKMVLENLELAIAVWSGTKKGLITKDHLPQGRAVVTTDEGSVVEVDNPLELGSDRELLRLVNNHLRGAVALSAMQTHNTLARVHPQSPLHQADPDLGGAQCAMYLLHQSFSTNMLAPVWDCPPGYRKAFEIKPISFVLDATELHGTSVCWDHFGGLSKYMELLKFCAQQVKEGVAGADELSRSNGIPSTKRQLRLSATENLGPSLVEFVLTPDFVRRKVRLSGPVEDTVYEGLIGGLMPFWGRDRLSDDDLEDIVKYLTERPLPECAAK